MIVRSGPSCLSVDSSVGISSKCLSMLTRDADLTVHSFNAKMESVRLETSLATKESLAERGRCLEADLFGFMVASLLEPLAVVTPVIDKFVDVGAVCSVDLNVKRMMR